MIENGRETDERECERRGMERYGIVVSSGSGRVLQPGRAHHHPLRDRAHRLALSQYSLDLHCGQIPVHEKVSFLLYCYN